MLDNLLESLTRLTNLAFWLILISAVLHAVKSFIDAIYFEKVEDKEDEN